MPEPATYNLVIYQGDTFEEDFTFETEGATPTPINITGYSFRAQIRRRASDDASLADFTTTITDAPGGIVQLSLTSEETADLDPGRAVWDLEWTDTLGRVKTHVAGRVRVKAQVTR